VQVWDEFQREPLSGPALEAYNEIRAGMVKKLFMDELMEGVCRQEETSRTFLDLLAKALPGTTHLRNVLKSITPMDGTRTEGLIPRATAPASRPEETAVVMGYESDDSFTAAGRAPIAPLAQETVPMFMGRTETSTVAFDNTRAPTEAMTAEVQVTLALRDMLRGMDTLSWQQLTLQHDDKARSTTVGARHSKSDVPAMGLSGPNPLSPYRAHQAKAQENRRKMADFEAHKAELQVSRSWSYAPGEQDFRPAASGWELFFQPLQPYQPPPRRDLGHRGAVRAGKRDTDSRCSLGSSELIASWGEQDSRVRTAGTDIEPLRPPSTAPLAPSSTQSLGVTQSAGLGPEALPEALPGALPAALEAVATSTRMELVREDGDNMSVGSTGSGAALNDAVLSALQAAASIATSSLSIPPPFLAGSPGPAPTDDDASVLSVPSELTPSQTFAGESQPLRLPEPLDGEQRPTELSSPGGLAVTKGWPQGSVDTFLSSLMSPPRMLEIPAAMTADQGGGVDMMASSPTASDASVPPGSLDEAGSEIQFPSIATITGRTSPVVAPPSSTSLLSSKGKTKGPTPVSTPSGSPKAKDPKAQTRKRSKESMTGGGGKADTGGVAAKVRHLDPRVVVHTSRSPCPLWDVCVWQTKRLTEVTARARVEPVLQVFKKVKESRGKKKRSKRPMAANVPTKYPDKPWSECEKQAVDMEVIRRVDGTLYHLDVYAVKEMESLEDQTHESDNGGLVDPRRLPLISPREVGEGIQSRYAKERRSANMDKAKLQQKGLPKLRNIFSFDET
jgi:hypothetical protein